MNFGSIVCIIEWFYKTQKNKTMQVQHLNPIGLVNLVLCKSVLCVYASVYACFSLCRYVFQM